MATTFDRQFLKTDFPDLIALIQQTHKMGPEIEKELFIDNTPVENLCHQRGYFVILHGKKDVADIYLHYVMDHVITNVELKLLARSLQEVTIYDSYQEYETARVRTLSAVKPEDQEGLNLN